MPTESKPTIGIVKEVLNIIKECDENDQSYNTSIEVCMYLKGMYGWDRAQCTELLIGAQLIYDLNIDLK